MNTIAHTLVPQVEGVYLDAQGSERPRPEAIEAVTYYLNEGFGNPAATNHARGRKARSVLETARDRVGTAFGASPDGIIFTSGATEANNLVMASFGSDGVRHIVASEIEHKSVLSPAARAAASGGSFNLCPVDSLGRLNLEALDELVTTDTDIVSVMHANNELGTIQPISEVAAICRKRGALCHVDASQTAGRMPLNLEELGIDILTISGHKFGGPTGVGALIVNPGLVKCIRPQVIGGGQESGLRAGTTPIAQCAGMAAALDAAIANLSNEGNRLATLRNLLLSHLAGRHGFFLNGDPDNRLSCNINGGFDGIEALSLMRKMPNIHFAAGSACTTGASENHVLNAIGLSPQRQKSTFRISLSWSTTDCDVAAACQAFDNTLNSIRRRAA